MDLRCSRHLVVLCLALTVLPQTLPAPMSDCYLPNHVAQRCLPPFINAAFRKNVVASNTCGTPAERYCVQTGVTGVTHSCHTCNSEIPARSHGSEFLTDLNDDGHPTWWQSSTMLNDVQYPNMVNLTLHLNKTFDITYVRLRFHTSRPESFAIYKKKCETCDWQPFQYYSGSCFSTYGIDNKEIVTVENEQKALCTDDFSDISPLTGGNVAFSTLESRPSAYNFDRSPVLQDWVRAVAIRISLNRINTFGDEVFNDPKILRSYYYGISDLSIGGRCACNGHSSECLVGNDGILECQCQHNTAGKDCERCADMFNDRPWARGTRENGGECRACDCNGMADTCFFDMELYRSTGHGGHCTGCRDNTDGPRCEFCRPYHYRDSNQRCLACECNAIGSFREQCDESGRCTCKPGVGGVRCDQCLEGYYGLSEGGCRRCACSPAGTVEGSTCDSATGKCVCKLNVEGRLCDRCKPATMNMQETNPYGCTACFCFGHSSVCTPSNEYTVANIISEFQSGDDGWMGEDLHGNPVAVYHNNGRITMRPGSNYLTYFVAPGKFLGVQRFSYNQFLEFELSVQNMAGSHSQSRPVALPSHNDIILEGHGYKVTASITSQGNPVPTTRPQVYRFRLHEAAGFYPRLAPLEFQKMLNSLDKLLIRSTYGEGLLGHLDNVQLTSAEYRGRGPVADWVERCEADGFDGLFTERCAPGYTRDPPNGGVYAPCVPCMCNGHAQMCDPDTGVCECGHNTIGDHCELCADGFYFSGDESRRGTSLECQPCPCPDRSACVVIDDGSVVCTNCPEGHAGKLCDVCMDGWFGDPRGRGPCLRCTCNGNIDENAVMNCDRTTGECLKCIHNTTGFHCERCLDGYFGSPFSQNPAEQCQLCECNSLGSNHITSCNSNSGQCKCLANVEGRQCEQCRSGYWNIASGQGCEACNCNQLGASTGECDQDSGQCLCLPGVTGQRCDRCLPNHYGLSRQGCTACNCNSDGSASLQCNDDGVCICKDGVFGTKCDRCQENYHDLANGCIVCPTCYGLVQEAVNEHRSELDRLEEMIEKADELPGENQNNAEFREALDQLNSTVYEILDKALENQKKWDALEDQYSDTIATLNEMLEKLSIISYKFDQCNETFQNASGLNSDTKDEVDTIRNTLEEAEDKLKQAMMDLNAAQKLAEDSANKENNMSRLAQEAEDLAALHEAISKNITDTAKLAFDKSKKARDSIQEAIDLLDKLLLQLADLIESDNKIPALRALRDELLAQSDSVKNNTEGAKNDSTYLFTEALKLSVPDVDTEEMNRMSGDILTEAENFLPRLDELEQEYRENYAELQNDADEARLLLEMATTAEKTTAKLLAQVDSILHSAQYAVTRGTNAYAEVLATISTLESFDEEISRNQQAAEEALAKAGEIQRKIDNATETTEETRAIIGQARAVAERARDNAKQAEAIAEAVKSDAERVKDEAVASHARANRISEDVTSLSLDLLDISRDLSLAEDKVNGDQKSITEVTNSARDAKRLAATTEKRVADVLRQLEDFLNQLNQGSDVSDDELTALENRYSQLQATVDGMMMEDTISRLEGEVEQHKQVLSQYASEVAALRADVLNLQSINATIPQDCSKGAQLEQP